MIAYRPEDFPERAVTLSPEDVRQAKRLLGLLTSATEQDERDLYPGESQSPSAHQLLLVARFFLLMREERGRHFSPAMFGEPAWDLLLSLYVSEAEGASPTISCLAKTAGTPVTTAMRWLDYLEEKRLIERRRSEDDRRASTVALSHLGRSSLEAYFGDVLTRMAALLKA